MHPWVTVCINTCFVNICCISCSQKQLSEAASLSSLDFHILHQQDHSERETASFHRAGGGAAGDLANHRRIKDQNDLGADVKPSLGVTETK